VAKITDAPKVRSIPDIIGRPSTKDYIEGVE